MDDQGKETPEIGGIDSRSNWRAETLKEEPKPKPNLLQRLFAKFRRKTGETTGPDIREWSALGGTAVARRERAEAEAEKVANQPLTREAGKKALHSEPDQPTASEPES